MVQVRQVSFGANQTGFMCCGRKGLGYGAIIMVAMNEEKRGVKVRGASLLLADVGDLVGRGLASDRTLFTSHLVMCKLGRHNTQ